MRVRALIPDAKCLRVESIEVDEGQTVRIGVRSIVPIGHCPSCGRASRRVHSWYQRQLTDLPWQGAQVCVIWSTRKFFCDSVACTQKIFTERQPSVAEPRSRRTERLSVALRCIAFACGGEMGARLAERLGMKISADSLLREIRKTSLPDRPTPRALGVDDWAYCKGKRYGTLLCDLERGHPVELLSDRTSESLQQWLQDHDGVEIISRDRSDIYRKGATEGAPHAVQVADRFHLMKNLRDALGRFLEGKSKRIAEATKGLEASSDNDTEPTPPPSDTKAARQKATNRAKRMAVYERVCELHRQGLSARSIAAKLGIHRGTVAIYVRADGFPERGTRNYPSSADSYRDYLRQRWESGCSNATLLWQEIQRRGFSGSYSSVRRLLARWRTSDGRAKKNVPARKLRVSAKQLSWLLVKGDLKLSDDERRLKDRILEQCAEIRRAWQLLQDFIAMMRNRDGTGLDDWMQRATRDEVPSSIRQFAEGLKADLAAVTQALVLPWNNGPSEGHISRLKMIKRQMYGRARFDLLRARFLFAA